MDLDNHLVAEVSISDLKNYLIDEYGIESFEVSRETRLVLDEYF